MQICKFILGQVACMKGHMMIVLYIKISSRFLYLTKEQGVYFWKKKGGGLLSGQGPAIYREGESSACL